MPIQVSYPGVYVQEIPGGQPVVAAISTASTAFVDFFARGPMNEAKRVVSMADVERVFGGLHTLSEASYGLRQYFLNGGQEAWVVRTGDGKATKACLKITVKTPGLPARVKASYEHFLESQKAAAAAVAAAKKAGETLAALGGDISADERKKGAVKLRGFTADAADATNQAAEATRQAAIQAQAASDELALAIAQAKGGSGPVADRTSMAAQKSADGANAASSAANATSDITGVAQRALSVAEAALKAGAAARAASAAAADVQDVLNAAVASSKAAASAATEAGNAADAKNLTGAQQAAGRAAAAALEAADQAQTAAENAAAAAQAVVDRLKVQKADTTAAQAALDTANAAVTAAKGVAQEAGSADWDAQTAASPKEALTAAQAASAAAAKAQGIAGYGTPADKNALGAAFSLLGTVLTMAKDAANDAAYVAGNVAADGKSEPIDPVVKAAIKAIDDSIGAAKRASLAARDGAQDAKVAADCVTSGVSMLVARAAENSAGKAMQATTEVIAQSKAIKIQVSTANMAAQSAVKSATDKAATAEAACKAPVDDAKKALDDVAAKAKVAAEKATAAMTAKGEAADKAAAVDKADAAGKDAAVAAAKDAAAKAKTATDEWTKAAGEAADAETKATTLVGNCITAASDAGEAGLAAADNALAASEAVEKAAVATSQVSVQAAVSADVAAQAAKAAVLANEEANQEPTLTVDAINEGEWGNNLEVTLTVTGTNFDLKIREVVMQNGVERQLQGESYSNLTLDSKAAANKQALALVNHNSNLVRLRQIGPKIEGAYPEEKKGKYLENGVNGGLASPDQLIDSMKALDNIEPSLFNLLCLPAVGNFDDAQANVAITAAHVYCGIKRAFLIVDIPQKVQTVDQMKAWAANYGNAKAYNMAVYFPRLIIPDPLNEYRPRNVGPSGTVAGIYSRTDTARGVWKAPAGVEAVIQGAEIAVKLNDDMNGQLNPLGINVLRSFPIYGQIVWGARTLAGADPLSSEYKYINVRRLMNHIEESVFRSMKWAVFEPNNENLWSKIRLQINGFLSSLYAAGAFQGTKPSSAYFVRCDGTTTTPLDIDLGIVNVFVGVAPSKPAEFIILSFQQIAGQTA